MKKNSFSISNRIVVVEAVNLFSRFLKKYFPKIDITSAYNTLDFVEIDLNEDDVLFIVDINEEQPIPTEYIDDVKWIFIVKSNNSTKIELDKEMFYIEHDWIKSDVLNYIKTRFEIIAKEIESQQEVGI